MGFYDPRGKGVILRMHDFSHIGHRGDNSSILASVNIIFVKSYYFIGPSSRRIVDTAFLLLLFPFLSLNPDFIFRNE